MFDAKLFANLVEHVHTAGSLLFSASRKAIGELAAVVSQQLDDLDWAGLLDLGEEIHNAAVGLVCIDLDEDPVRGAVDESE